jgi:hypothetical protein
MSAHYWLFPWLALFVSLTSAVIGLLLGKSSNPAEKIPRIATPYIVVWLITTLLLVFGALEVGDWGTTDYIPARGVLAGAVSGLLLAGLIRRRFSTSAAQTTAIIGIMTAVLAASRLWLTHGEVSGLISVALSSGFSIICLVVAPAYFEPDNTAASVGGMSLSYVVIMTCAMLLGFARASTLGDLYWADLPLLMGASLAVGSLVAMAVNRFGIIARAVAILAAAFAVTVPLALTVAHALPVIGISALGVFAVATPLLLKARAQNAESPTLLGQLLIVAAVTLAFTLLSGYGIAMLAMGILVVATIAATGAVRTPASWLSLIALLLLYRLEVLQNGSAVRAIGLADLWDLLAVGLGILLPRLVIANLPLKGSNNALSWPFVIQWITTLAIPSLLLDYIWQPRSLTGLFLGLAVGQFALVSSNTDDDDNVAITSMVSGLLLFVFLPGLDTVGAPNRGLRIICVVVVALLVVVRILIPAKRPVPKAS